MLRKFLDNEMFRRVVKVYKEEKSSSEQASSNATGDTSRSNTSRTVRQRKTKSMNTITESNTKDDETKEKEKIKKKKFKFELHDDQLFMDLTNEFYVWIYSPTTIKQYIVGALLVIGCIAVCLFPLWPLEVRTAVYYLSMVLASLLGLLLSLALIKYIIFAGVWLLTMGKIKFWLLPNLTEDVGFIESFIPLYVLDTIDKKKSNKTNEERKENTIDQNENLNEDNTNNVVDLNENEYNDEDIDRPMTRSSSADDADDRNKPSDEDFEVLSKDELETK